MILNGRNEVTVLFPRMVVDLFDRLQSGEKNPIGLVQGLRIVQQMTDALENCWIRGIHHVDLRITNVLVLIIFTSFPRLSVSSRFSLGSLRGAIGRIVFFFGRFKKYFLKKKPVPLFSSTICDEKICAPWIFSLEKFAHRSLIFRTLTSYRESKICRKTKSESSGKVYTLPCIRSTDFQIVNLSRKISSTQCLGPFQKSLKGTSHFKNTFSIA